VVVQIDSVEEAAPGLDCLFSGDEKWVLCLVVSFRPVVASLGPLDGLFYLKDSFFQSISFTAKGQFMSSKF